MIDDEQIKILEDQYTYHFFFNHGLFDELKHYEDLISETDSFLRNQIESFKDKSENEIMDERFGKKTQYENIFPSILWKSIFLSLYFLLESSLDQICNNLKTSENYKLSYKDISGNGIYRSSSYLKKVCDLNETFKAKTWNNITDFNKIRNTLVHSDGIFSKNNKELISICKKYKNLNNSDFDNENISISLDHKFCQFTLEKITIFVDDIYREMMNKRQQATKM